METIKNFFTSDRFRNSWLVFYNGFGSFLESVFGKIQYEPVKILLINPWFWIIVIALFIIIPIFRRR